MLRLASPVHAALLAAVVHAAAPAPAQLRAPSAGPAAPGALEPVVVFAGPPGGVGAVEVYDAATGGLLAGPGRLADLRLLPLDCAGRTQIEALFPDRARRHDDVPGAARLALPFGAGSLYHYERATPGGPAFGFLLVREGAFPRVLFELPGTAAVGGDPFLTTVGVAPDGRSLLVATTLSAGGDLFEVSTLGHAVELRTASAPPLAFSPDGLWLGRAFGLGVAPDGLWRFARAAGAAATPVPAAGAGPWTGQAVMNRARRHALLTSGADPLAREAWVVGATGPAVRASSAPAAIADAGFAPAHTSGPWMALSDDGTLAAWSESFVDTGVVPPRTYRDIRLQRVALPVAGPLDTGDPYLTDTLDEVARMGFYRPDTLAYAAGEVGTPTEGGIATADFFSARLDPGGAPVLQNLTLTSGDPTVPFTARPTLTPSFTRYLPGERVLLFDENDEALMLLELSTGTLRTLEPDVKDLFWLEPVGDWVCAAVRRRNGQRPIEVLRFRADFAGAPASLDPGSPNHAFLHPAARGGALTWVESVAGLERVERTFPATGVVETWSGGLGAPVPPLALTAAGDVRFARGAGAAGVESRTWRTSGPDLLLLHPLRPGHWMP